MRPRAFQKRSLSAGLAQKAGGCPERREIVARRDGLGEIPKLRLPVHLINRSSDLNRKIDDHDQRRQLADCVEELLIGYCR